MMLFDTYKCFLECCQQSLIGVLKKALFDVHSLKDLFLLISFCLVTHTTFALEALSDEQASNVYGRELFSMNEITPTATGNANGLTFYTVGMQATLQLNQNIKRLQLGCGGVKDPGCDIDISHVRITGKSPGPSGTYVDSDATLINPYLQFAVKNANSASTRRVVGYAFGAQNISGIMSVGENPTPNVPGTVGGKVGGETGINTLSGSMEQMLLNLRNPMDIKLLGATVASGNAYVKVTPRQPNIAEALMTQEDANNIPTGVYYQYVSGSRMTGVNLGKIDLTVPNIMILAPFIRLAAFDSTATYSPFNLIDVHNFDISSTKNAGLLLSVNSQNILWPQIGSLGLYTFPNTTQTLDSNGYTTSTGFNSDGSPISIEQLKAQTGWWLSVPRATIGNTSGFISTSKTIVPLTDVVGSLLSGNLEVDSVNTRQIPVVNCYGGRTFC